MLTNCNFNIRCTFTIPVYTVKLVRTIIAFTPARPGLDGNDNIET